MVIFARDAEIDLECNEIKDQLANQAILEAKHSVSKFRKTRALELSKFQFQIRKKLKASLRIR